MTEDEKTTQAARLKRALEGTDSGSDTRAGSLRGGSASGSDDDADSETINRKLEELGREIKQFHKDDGGDDTQASEDVT